jgi:hypothetical protein
MRHGRRLLAYTANNVGEIDMSYSGAGNEKAVTASDLNRTHVGLTASFQPDEFTVVFGRIGAIARKEGGVTIALDGVVGTGSLASHYSLPPTQQVYVQPDMLTNTESTIKDLFGKVQDNLRGHKGDQRPDTM